jgi:transposase
MWTDEQRKAHKPRVEGYQSDVSDEEWAIIEPMIPPARTGGRKRGTDMREVPKLVGARVTPQRRSSTRRSRKRPKKEGLH